MPNHLEQLISEPTHLRDDGSQSCIDLICTDQPYIFMDTGVFSSLDSRSKHNIIHSTLNVNIPRRPPFKHKIWDYNNARVDLLRADLQTVNWQDLFFNLNTSEKVFVFTDVFMNITNKIITCNKEDA